MRIPDPQTCPCDVFFSIYFGDNETVSRKIKVSGDKVCTCDSINIGIRKKRTQKKKKKTFDVSNVDAQTDFANMNLSRL